MVKKVADCYFCANAIYALDVIAETTKEEEMLDEIERLKGEACFIRAMVMMELTMYWGEVPVVDIATMNNSALSAIGESMETDY